MSATSPPVGKIPTAVQSWSVIGDWPPRYTKKIRVIGPVRNFDISPRRVVAHAPLASLFCPYLHSFTLPLPPPSTHALELQRQQQSTMEDMKEMAVNLPGKGDITEEEIKVREPVFRELSGCCPLGCPFRSSLSTGPLFFEDGSVHHARVHRNSCTPEPRPRAPLSAWSTHGLSIFGCPIALHAAPFSRNPSSILFSPSPRASCFWRVVHAYR